MNSPQVAASRKDTRSVTPSSAEAASALTVQSLVAGASLPSQRRAPLFDPARGQRIGEVELAGSEQVELAVAAAQGALAAWSSRPVIERSRVLMRYAAALEADKEHIAALITREHGKPRADALGSLQRGMEVVEFATAATQLLKGEHSDAVARGVSTRSVKRPLGVCLGIVPFNYPAMIPLWMFPLALVCGNTFILKPSEKTPSAANRLAELLTDAGAPAGVLNVLHGDAQTVELLLEHPGIASVSFVGSSVAARSVYTLASQQGKRVQALGGAKNHAIVMPDADPIRVVEGLINGAFNSAGQRCMAVSVAVMVGTAYDQFMPLIDSAARKLRTGPGEDATTEVPPLQSGAQKERILGMLTHSVQEGAHLSLDGRAVKVAAEYKDGYYLGPTIVDKVQRSMRVYTEEVFGPVLVVLRASSLVEAIAIANEHPLANGAVLFTRSGGDAAIFERDIQCGMPGVNVAVPSPVAYHSFGGWRTSMWGDLAMHGPDAINFYTRRQVLTSRWT